jgi:Na+/melibiose symporter-like transporter
VSERSSRVVLKKKKKTLRDLASDYKTHFGMMFSNTAAIMLIIGCSLRLIQVIAMSYFLSNYMKVYKDDYITFTEWTAVGSFIGNPLSTFITGAIIDYFGPKTEYIVPLLCIIKSILCIPM